MSETNATRKAIAKRLLSIARSLVAIVVLGVARFLLGKSHRQNNRRLDGAIVSAIVIHWCSIQALCCLRNPYSVGDRILYKNIDRQSQFFVVSRIVGDSVISDGDGGLGYAMMDWRTLRLNELLHQYRMSDLGIKDVNELLCLETIL